VELAPGGRARAVQPGERAAFCAAALRARLQESAAQCSAMREGLHSVVPAAALALLPWWRLERGVAGSSAVSAAALRATSHVTVDSRLEGSPPNPFPRGPARGGPARRKATPGPCSLITSPLRAALHRVRGDPACCLWPPGPPGSSAPRRRPPESRLGRRAPRAAVARSLVLGHSGEPLQRRRPLRPAGLRHWPLSPAGAAPAPATRPPALVAAPPGPAMRRRQRPPVRPAQRARAAAAHAPGPTAGVAPTLSPRRRPGTRRPTGRQASRSCSCSPRRTTTTRICPPPQPAPWRCTSPGAPLVCVLPQAFSCLHPLGPSCSAGRLRR